MQIPLPARSTPVFLWLALGSLGVIIMNGAPAGAAQRPAASAETTAYDSSTLAPGVDAEGSRSGLLGEYRTLVPGAEAVPLIRVDAKPAFTWGDSSPHPRIPPGPFRVVWTGWMVLKEADSFRFSAFLWVN